MPDDAKLLADYVKQGSEDAFRQLVERYLPLVYAAAIRQVGGDAHLAQDVAQRVFVDFARKAGKLSGDAPLGGWLHRHACYVAATFSRTERRRKARETQAIEMSTMQPNRESKWEGLAILLDDAINQLGKEDRTAIVLRFLEQRTLASVGQALGVTEDAAQKTDLFPNERRSWIDLKTRAGTVPQRWSCNLVKISILDSRPSAPASRCEARTRRLPAIL